MFLKKKRYGHIKGRVCSDGRNQWGCKNREEASYPTVSTEAMMLSCIMDSLEGRDVAMVGILRALLHAEMDDIVNMQIYGAMAQLLMWVDPGQYEKHVAMEKRKKVFYVRMNKALYGTLKEALLF